MDFRKILETPFIYSTYQYIVGGINARKLFIKNDAKIKPTDKVLDIGCGPGDILTFLPELDYTGIDIDQKYIDKAQSKNIKNAKFYCTTFKDFESSTKFESGTFDTVISTGVLHHLNDSEANAFFDLAKKSLKPNGKLLTLDGCFLKKQNIISKELLKRDRGQFIRTEIEYLNLAKKHFKKTSSKIEENYFHIPYTLIILTCKN